MNEPSLSSILNAFVNEEDQRAKRAWEAKQPAKTMLPPTTIRAARRAGLPNNPDVIAAILRDKDRLDSYFWTHVSVPADPSLYASHCWRWDGEVCNGSPRFTVRVRVHDDGSPTVKVTLNPIRYAYLSIRNQDWPHQSVKRSSCIRLCCNPNHLKGVQ